MRGICPPTEWERISQVIFTIRRNRGAVNNGPRRIHPGVAVGASGILAAAAALTLASAAGASASSAAAPRPSTAIALHLRAMPRGTVFSSICVRKASTSRW